MAQYSQRTQPMHRPGQTDHGHGGGALAYGGKPAAGGVVAAPQPRAPPAAPYAQPYPPAQLRLHQPGYGSAALTYREGGYGRSGGAVSEYRGGGGTRMSLLATGYLPPPAPPAHHPPPADPPPFKKIRLSAERPTVTPLPHHQQLRIDTREPVNPYNTVEVLSPNPPSEPTIEDQSFRTTKDELLQQISKVDREMALSETTLTKLKKKAEELEQSASKPARTEEPEEAPPRHRSLAQCVYADNRKKAAQAHAKLSHLGPPVLYPLYNQPQDTEVYHENIRKHRVFRKRLAEHVRRLKLEAEKREDALAEAYSRRAAEWARRVDRIEQGQKRKAKDARNREFFEKVFPELRKQREERERFNRLGARVKSEAELEEIADGLHEQEHEDKKMRSLTVVPPLLRDPRDTRPVYIDTNRRCMDMEAEHKELQMRNVWTKAERDIFKEKYLQHPKNFGLIASFLSRKSVRDCVRFYYLSKKSQNYKQLLRKPRQRRSQRNNAPRPVPEPELPAGVTTRLQRSQGTTARTVDAQSNVLDDPMSGAVGDVPVCDISCIPVPPDAPAPAAPAQLARSELTRTPPLPPSPNPASSAPPAPVTSTSSSVTAGSPVPSPLAPDTPLPVTSAEAATAAAVITTTSLTSAASSPTPTVISTATTTITVAVVTSAPPTQQLSQPPTPTQPPPTPETAVIERTGTPTTTLPSITTTTITTTVSTPCAVCNVSGATRAVTRSRAIYYGLREENAAGARVCEPCHCRCVRSRYTRCPVPTCPGPRVRAKRLRHLPPRWHDLSLELKRPLMDEFQIPSELSKCCLACFKRITRRLETIGESPPTEPTEEEASRFRTLLREHGTAWDRMSSACGRTPASLKAFYFTYRKKFQLDALVERTPQKGSDTDDSVLSSGDTDTASAESPRPPPPPEPAPPRHRRDEYDSSATETADEENDAPSTKQSLPPSTSSLPVSVSTSIPTSQPSCSLPPSRNGPGTPLTVRDVVLNMIEISLMKSSQPNPPNKLHQTKVSSSNAPRESLATLSVVSSTHGTGGAAPTPRSPQRPATITPVAQPPPPAPDAPKEGVVVVIEPRPESLLDLSVKRPRQDFAFPQHNKNTVYRNSAEYPTYRTQSERESPTQYNSKPKPVTTLPRPTLKPTNPKGSITLGTPVETRFDPRRTPPDPKTGSITAGTPVHGTHHLPEKRSFEYYKGRSPGGVYYAGATNQPRSQSPSYSPNAYGQHNRGSYGGFEQRQIIAADFITSQQMHGGARRERTERPAERSASPQYSPRREREPVSVIQRHTPHVYPHPHPPPGGQYSPRRERELVSVIQRHTPHMYPQPAPHSPPGHEAFTSLVDVASAATALPVPREPKPEPKHDIRIQERMQRDIAMQKYHQQQIQFQVLERDRRAQQQAQYIERDRQMALQSRERDRALAAIQERHIPMDHPQHPHAQHQGQMMHERHHMQHSQQSVSSAESDRRMMAPAYTVAKHRPLAPHVHDRKDTRPAAPAVCGGAVVSAGAAAAAAAAAAGQAQAGGARPAEGKLTAATLIDAIITHQISQNSTEQRFQQTIRREDVPGPAPPPQQDRGVGEDGHTTSIKLGDLASNIIVRDYCSPTASLVHHNSNYNAPKHVPYLEPVSPPDNHHANRNNSNRRYSGVPSVGVGVSGSGGVLTAYDYVTNRIVEVMRSDADERKPPLAFPTTPYAYPYSALNVATPTADATGSAGGAPAAAPTPAAPVAPEPAPLMSAQYEPLSDED